MAITRARIARGLIAPKSVFALRSLVQLHAPPPPGMEQEADVLPFASTAVTKRTPPVLRTANSFNAIPLKSNDLLSENTKLPLKLVFARLPAAKLVCPPATLPVPPATVA